MDTVLCQVIKDNLSNGSQHTTDSPYPCCYCIGKVYDWTSSFDWQKLTYENYYKK